MERKCIKCIHFPCLKVNCSAENTEVCDLYETEVSRAIKKLSEEGYYDFEGERQGELKIERLNSFKTIKVLYGNTFSMHLEQLEQLQNDIETVLSELEKKEAIINEMAKQLVEAHGWFYSEFDNFTEKDWIDYFRKKVIDINVGDIPEQN